MPQLLTKTLLTICAASVLFTSCQPKKYSTDTVLPSAYSPSVVMGSDNNVVYGLNPADGSKNWEVNLPAAIYSSPLVYNGSVYLTCINYAASLGDYDTVYKVNSRTGAVTAKLVMDPNYVFTVKATPIVHDSILYLATMSGMVYAMDTGRASQKWAFTADGPIESSPALFKDSLYFASTAGTAYCIKTSDGSLVWSYNVGAGKSFASSPAISEPYMYVGCNDSSMYCFYLEPPSASGQLKWSFKTKGAINSSPAAAYGKCIFGSNDFHVYCLDTMTGLQVWRDSTKSNINSSPVISSNQLVYIGSNDYHLYALDIRNGEQIWKFSTNGLVKSSPLLYKGTIFLGSYDKYLYALDAASGSLKWTKNINGQMQCSPAMEDFSGVQYNSQVSGFTNY